MSTRRGFHLLRGRHRSFGRWQQWKHWLREQFRLPGWQLELDPPGDTEVNVNGSDPTRRREKEAS